MKAWMLSIAQRLGTRIGLYSAQARPDRRRVRSSTAPIRIPNRWTADATRCEGLEGRALLAVSAVVPFAEVAGQVTAANQTSQVQFQLGPGQLRSSQSSTVIVGFAVEAASGAADSPKIVRVTGPNGQLTPISIADHGETAQDRSARQTHLFTRVIPLTSQSQTLTVDVTSLNKKTGGYIVDAFLAGDVNGDGTVDASDLTAVQAAYESSSGQTNFNAAADLNGDGRVGCIDRTLTILNMGAQEIPAATVATAATPTPTPSPTTTPVSVDLTATPSATVATAPIAYATPVNVTTPLTLVTPVSAATTPVYATSNASIPLTTATPIAVATPVVPAATPVYATNYNPVSVAAPSPQAVAATSSVPVVLAPVATSTMPLAVNGTGIASSATPVYVLTQPSGTAATTTSSAPVYLYGQPVVGGVGTTAATVPSLTLFNKTTPSTTTAQGVPVPVYLYGNS